MICEHKHDLAQACRLCDQKHELELAKLRVIENNLTLRDQFAMNCPHEFVKDYMQCYKHYDNLTYELYLTSVCNIRYKYADAMLAEREKQ